MSRCGSGPGPEHCVGLGIMRGLVDWGAGWRACPACGELLSPEEVTALACVDIVEGCDRGPLIGMSTDGFLRVALDLGAGQGRCA